tara:strand:+ start:2879 stop:3142 length:264 start_codon:yes stop_codon:yes gene_type:complete
MTQTISRFDNGYGASIINHGYGSEKGLYELAVVKWITTSDGFSDYWDMCYDTPIADDVIGRLSMDKVIEIIEKIKELPAHKGVCLVN